MSAVPGMGWKEEKLYSRRLVMRLYHPCKEDAKEGGSYRD